MGYSRIRKERGQSERGETTVWCLVEAIPRLTFG